MSAVGTDGAPTAPSTEPAARLQPLAGESEDERYMRRALELAARGLNTTDPNPRVGCVLVQASRVVGEGWHERAGGPHAEVNALRSAGAAAEGATAYVTLEPCAHTGRTPPCVEALAAARLRRVFYGAGDPNPLINGAGVTALRTRGIEVIGELLPEESRALNPGFFKRMRVGLPWVRVKLAMSLDGRTALAGGESRWITGEAARADVQRYRARSSVILTGSGTVLSDDPALDVRLEATSRQPLRVILDSALRVPARARVFARPAEALVFTASTDSGRRTELERSGIAVETAAASNGGLILEPVLRRLAALEANEVWVEAGARLSGALLSAGLVDELIVYIAPSLLGQTARPLLELPPIEQLEARVRLQLIETVSVGEDLRLTARPLPSAEAAPLAGTRGAD
jgi:diaminohydroxyphosphoribosylaminopyrimidine deaminase/5-amino-6-(5-phosphoribosylamino)uracil reductase